MKRFKEFLSECFIFLLIYGAPIFVVIYVVAEIFDNRYKILYELPSTIFTLLIFAIIFLAIKYIPSSSLFLPEPAKPYLTALKNYLSPYTFQAKRQILEEAKKSLKYDYKMFEKSYKKYHNSEYCIIMFRNKSSRYDRYDITELWVVCAILNFADRDSYVYKELSPKLKERLYRLYDTGRCPQEIYKAFPHVSYLVCEYEQMTMTQDS